MRRALAWLLFALFSCGEEMKPDTLLEELRVLGVRSTPADLAPGETAILEALVVDPSRPARASTVVWFSCDPDPLNLNRSYCSDMATLSQSSALFRAPSDGGAELPPGMRFAGLGNRAGYRAPEDLFAKLPPEDARRRLGTVAQLLLFAVAEELSPAASREELAALFGRVERKEVRSVLALFRIRVSEDPERNQNPRLSFSMGGAHLRLAESEMRPLELDAADQSFEEYQQLTPQGAEARSEKLIGAWYSTAGRFSESRVVLRSQTAIFRAPGSAEDPVPPERGGTLFAVVRDTRGGQSWAEYPFHVCDPSLPPPRVSQLQPRIARRGERVSLSGEQLGSVLDVMLGEEALRGLSCSESRGVCEGYLPALPPGDYPVVVRGKHCQDLETGWQLRLE